MTQCGTLGGICRAQVGPYNLFFCESSLLRINQRRHSLRTRLWHTPPAAVKKTDGGKRFFCVSSLLRKNTVPYKGACSTQRQRELGESGFI